MAVPRDEVIDRTTVAAVIPAYLEEKHIADVVRRTRAQLDNVLVVDDGSTDATAATARRKNSRRPSADSHAGTLQPFTP